MLVTFRSTLHGRATQLTPTSDTLARAALAFIDEHGVEALTIRALGQKVGMHHTAVYRHYRSKNELLRAVLAIVITDAFAEAGPLPQDPETRLITLLSGLRKALRSHPAVTVAYLLPLETLGDSEAAAEYHKTAVQTLSDLGLSGHELVIRYLTLESYTLGASVFDFGGAPDHFASRSRRYKIVANSEFTSVVDSHGGVEAVTEAAFELGLRTLVAECAAAARARQAQPQ